MDTALALLGVVLGGAITVAVIVGLADVALEPIRRVRWGRSRR